MRWDKLRILHIGNTGGIANIIAKTMDRIYQTESHVLAKHDPYGLLDYGEILNNSVPIFLLKSILRARKYDIIHLHAYDMTIPFLRLLYSKPIVLHYHGSRIRNNWERRRKYWSHADHILVSTIDLLEGAPKCAEYLPNPIDSDLFYPRNLSHIPENDACYFRYDADDIAHSIAKKYGLKLTIYDRNHIHNELPEILSRHRWLIDVKKSKGIYLYPKGVYSKLALEALSIGLKVVSLNGDITDKFPSEHDSEKFSQKVFKLYQNLIDRAEISRS